MPSPEGCYVRVWDQPGFLGTSDFINGPRRYEDLRELPGNRAWRNRIKSLHLGPNAAAIVFSEEKFRGRNALLIADNGTGRFPTIPAPIQSLDIRCLPSQSAQGTLSELAAGRPPWASVPNDQQR